MNTTVVSLKDWTRKAERRRIRFEKERPIMAALRPMQLACHEPDACRQLWAAVMVQAVRDVARLPTPGSGSTTQQAAAKARAWFDAKDGAVGGFEWICNRLDMDSEVIRKRIARGNLRMWGRRKDRCA